LKAPTERRRNERLHEERLAIATPATNEPRINDRIRAKEVRLVGPDGGQIGIKPLPEALAIARDLDLDLVEVAAEAKPPVCRIMDYGKYKYEAAQKAKESRRKTVNVSIKEMKYRPKIGKGDFDTKTHKVEKFLADGHKVKVTLTFRGREMHHPDLGKKILDQVVDAVADIGKVEVFPRIDGRQMTMVLAPDRKAQAAAQRRLASEKEEANADTNEDATGVLPEIIPDTKLAPDTAIAATDTAEAATPEPETTTPEPEITEITDTADTTSDDGEA
jgi:translation initiation factor IF-3